MAEFLILNRHSYHDASHSGCSCWRQGDIIDVKPDGFQWGSEEIKPETFFVLEMPGMTVEEGKTYCQQARTNGVLIYQSLWCYDTGIESFINKETDEVVSKASLE